MLRHVAKLTALLVMTGWCAGVIRGQPARWQGQEVFVDLFDGKTLDGFTQHGGKAKYHVEEGQIVGTAVPNTPNSFLCTDRLFRDFVLEFEFRVDPGLNSGVQIRSRVFDSPAVYRVDGPDGGTRVIRVPAGRVHGYQVEIDPSPRAWTAGIYDEGRRGWLFDLKENEAARKAFRQNEWNHVRVECIGTSIRTWLNGVPAADLTDGMTREGFIALQVHGIGNNPENAGKQVRWRNLRIAELPPAP
ncbi:MAG: hypothetical protein KatS3mg110_3246 [Pirellulaceae bacterium]|nr:MAG: hypothetical protein KatS3mg110_3246 [Pirellulaceae bacterium]